jgi:hypothetical protein
MVEWVNQSKYHSPDWFKINQSKMTTHSESCFDVLERARSGENLPTEFIKGVKDSVTGEANAKAFLEDCNQRVTDLQEVMKRGQETGPRRYFKEDVFYKSPTVKEARATLPNDRIDIPNSYITKKMKYRSDEEIRSIWAKPMVDFEATPFDKYILARDANTDKSVQSQRSALLDSPHSPCRGIWNNMKMDKCFQPWPSKRTEEEILGDLECKKKLFYLIQCTNKHTDWYMARRGSFDKFLGIQVEDNLVSLSRKLSSYPKYDVPKTI